MTFFALVHGGAHGGWCWEALVPELGRLGHQSSAPDLPFDEGAGASAWADAVIATIPEDADDVVVVGHSLAGLALPVIAARRPVDRLVFLAAMVPVPGRTYLDVLTEEPDAITIQGVADVLDGDAIDLDTEPDDGAVPWSLARPSFYHDLPEELAREAWRRLRTQSLDVFSEVCPIDRWPDVASTYILATDDRAVSPEWSRRVASGRLGCDLIELPGGHSVFYGHPRLLAETLDRLATSVSS